MRSILLILSLVASSLTSVTSFADNADHRDRDGDRDYGQNRDRDQEVRTAARDIRHVFVIVLENKTFSNTFSLSAGGTSAGQDPYLQQTLVPQGALLTEYFGTGHVSLDNYISMISGQSPTPDTVDDCIPGLVGQGEFTDVQETGVAPFHQVIASTGCVYPAHVKTLPNQLSERDLTWKAYMEDMGNDPARESATCGHPTLGGPDLTNSAEAPSSAVPAGDAYATRHDPFVYFHRIIDSRECNTHVVALTPKTLPEDLLSARTTPNYVFITPNLCNDGHDGDGTGTGTKCANGGPGGLTSADAFLKKWVPLITASPAFKRDGLLIITFDESNFTQSVASVSGQTQVTLTFNGDSCCHQEVGPNISGDRPAKLVLVNSPGLLEQFVINGIGGDQVGALLLSPFIKPGSTSNVPYNHYSMLRSLEDIFRLDEHLGYAAQPNPTIGNDTAIFKH
jgi:hypothetical protein